jgi:hypothetical protein
MLWTWHFTNKSIYRSPHRSWLRRPLGLRQVMTFAAPPRSCVFKEHQVYILTYFDLPGGVWWFLPKSQVSTN